MATNEDPPFIPRSNRAFDIHIRGGVEMEFYGSSGIDLGGDIVVRTDEVVATLTDVDGLPPNVEGAVDLHEKMSADDIVIERVCSEITASVRHALAKNRADGRS
ncbi:MAG: hypothetical protein WDZ34_02980 [Candidatus Saccharimonadales bacterium]